MPIQAPVPPTFPQLVEASKAAYTHWQAAELHQWSNRDEIFRAFVNVQALLIFFLAEKYLNHQLLPADTPRVETGL